MPSQLANIFLRPCLLRLHLLSDSVVVLFIPVTYYGYTYYGYTYYGYILTVAVPSRLENISLRPVGVTRSAPRPSERSELRRSMKAGPARQRSS